MILSRFKYFYQIWIQDFFVAAVMNFKSFERLYRKTGINGSQLAKMEKSIPHMPLPWNL